MFVSFYQKGYNIYYQLSGRRVVCTCQYPESVTVHASQYKKY